MNTTAFLSLEDIADNLPRYDESVVSVEMDSDLAKAYEELEDDIRSAMRQHRGNKSLMSILLNTLLLYPDHPQSGYCPFLCIASEYTDTAHPFHRLAIKHQDKIVGYLTDLLEPFAIDKRAAAAAILGVIDGALSTRMHYGTSKKIPILLPAQAVLKRFQSARSQHRG